MLPDVSVLNEKEESALLNFVENGGSLYISGANLGDFIKRLTGLHVAGITKENATYISPAAGGAKYFKDLNLGSPLMVESPQVLMEGDELKDNEVIATITLPYTDPKEPRFASIHSNPPGKETDLPTIIRKKYGKGEVIWSPIGLEKSDAESNRELFVRLIKSLAKKPLVFESDAPKPVEVIVFYKADESCYTVSVLNAQQQTPPLPVYDTKIRLNIADKVSAVRLLPEREAMDFEQDNEGITFVLPMLEIFAMIEVEIEKEKENE
jgi:hypothetical protein